MWPLGAFKRQKFVGDLAGFRFLAVGKNAAGESGTGELQFWNDELTEVIRDRGDLWWVVVLGWVSAG